MERFLRDRGLLDDERIDTITREVEAEVGELVERAETVEADPPAMFDHTYAEGTPRLREQRDYLEKLLEEHGEDRLTRDE
jgi:pyruvate dehydrogenase E1 component alpha subunit